MEPRAFKAVLVEELRHFFESQGLKKRNGLVFTGALSEDSLRWVGLSTAIRFPGQYITVNPVIGVRNQAVEKLVAALRGIEFHSYAPATLTVPVGWLTPERDCSPLRFALDREITPPLEDFERRFEQYGSSFYRRNSSLEALCSSLERNDAGVGESHYRLPACYYLLGRREEAANCVAKRLALLRGTSKGGLALDYEGYALRMARLCHTRCASRV